MLFSLPSNNGWLPVTTTEFHAQVIALAKGFVAAGIEPGDKIGLICKTRYEWTLIDFAVWFAGAVLVPIYETSSPSQIQWSMSDSGATSILIETPDHFAKFDEVHADLPLIGAVWQIDLGDLDKLVAGGVNVTDAEIERRRNLAMSSDIATLIYTSGSTGKPKGCVLTHATLSRSAATRASPCTRCLRRERRIDAAVHHTAHVFARFIAVLCVDNGVRVGHQRRHQAAPLVARELQADLPPAVPRVFEKVYNSAEQKAEAGGKGKIFRAAAADRRRHSGAGSRPEIPMMAEDQVRRCSTGSSTASCARRWAATSSTRCRDRRTARRSPRPLLPQPRHQRSSRATA